MKNIHVLPTDKPSYLYKKSDGTLHISDLFEGGNSAWKNQNIYITSDEEIKDGDWMIRDNENPIKVTKDFFWDFGVRYYKIILTTDQDLIKNGVQSIEDEFLEWFVKNPSCEKVEVVFNNRGITGAEKILKTFGEYKIILPKEEPKPIHQQIIDAVGGEDKFREIAKINPKKQSLEEVAERILFNNTKDIEIKYRGGKENIINAMIEIAKWQQERSYSEQDLEVAFFEGKFGKYSFNDWFEQFKKK